MACLGPQEALAGILRYSVTGQKWGPPAVAL